MEAAISAVTIAIIVLILLMRSGTGRAHGGSDFAAGSIEVNPWALLAFVVRASALGFFVFALVSIARGEAGLATVVTILVTLPLIRPSLVVDRVLVPLGMPATAFWFSRVMGEPRSGALIDAARALPGSGRRRPQRTEWLRWQVRFHLEPPRSAWDLVASAELKDATDDRAGARRLFEAVALLEVGRRTARWRRHAHRWLLADAASSGDWPRVRRLASTAPPLHEARLIAAAMAPVRRPAGLVLRWAATPRHAATWAWLRRGLRPRSAPLVPAGEPDLQRALRLHARLDANTITWQDLGSAAEAWERVDSPALRAEIGRRIAVLEARATPGDVVDAMLGAVEQDLVALVRAVAAPPGDDAPQPRLLQSARDQVVQERFETLQDAAWELAGLARPSAPPPADICWSAWGAWRRAWNALQLVAPPDELASVLTAQWGTACNFGANAANRFGQRMLAREVFRFLLRECRRLHVPADMKLLEGNVKATR
jgi:hypothetical protein